MVQPVNVIQAVDAVAYVVRAGIPGALVECGVWRGGVMMAMLLEAQACGDTSRHAYLYDTFEGMSAPGPQDMSLVNGKGQPLTATTGLDGQNPHTTYAAKRPYRFGQLMVSRSLEDVQTGIASLGLPSSHIHYVKGKVEDTLPGTLPEQIALLRLDTDWYESTKAEMAHLFPRLSPGGVLIVDDYGRWAGSRQAVDEYLGEHQPTMFLVHIGHVAYGVKR